MTDNLIDLDQNNPPIPESARRLLQDYATRIIALCEENERLREALNEMLMTHTAGLENKRAIAARKAARALLDEGEKP